MKLTKTMKLFLIADAVERISDLTGTDDIPLVVEALTEDVLNNAEAEAVKAYHSNEEDV